jgi:mannose-6-phosphate isomerase-like protein (cupin superfamily)
MQPTIRPADPQAEYYFKEGCFILELSNTPDDPVVSIARARVCPGTTTRRHRLIGITERYVVLEGTGRVDVGGQAPQPVAPGDVVIIPPGQTQRITNTGTGDLVFLAVCTPRFNDAAYQDMEGPPDR